MSWRSDSSSLISGAWVSSAYPGHGILGSMVPSTGDFGPSPVYNDLSLPADAAKEYRWSIVTPPASGTLTVSEDCSFDFVAPGDGVYTFTYRLWEDGVDKGTATATIVIGSAGPVVLSDLHATAITGTTSRLRMTFTVLP